MKQYRQHRQTNEQTWTTEHIAPVFNTYLQHRQSDTDNGRGVKFHLPARIGE